MLVAYSYKIEPSRNPAATKEKHVEMLRLQHNFRIHERSQAYEQVSVESGKPLQYLQLELLDLLESRKEA